MNIYLTTAKRVYRYAYPVLESLFAENTDSEIYVYIVSEDLIEEDLEHEIELARRYGNHICVSHFDESMAREVIKTAPSDHWPLGTLGCYWLFHSLLPEDVDRILAIETDAIVIGSLRSFYDTSFDSAYAICPDAEHKPLTHRQLMNQIQGDLLTFVPSLYDVNAIRRDFSLQDILDADSVGVQALGHSQQELTFGVLFKDKIKFIPAPDICVEENSASLERFGIEYLRQCETTEKIIHFSSTSAHEKPWNPTYYLPGYTIWWNTAQRSPYLNWYIEQQAEWQNKQRDSKIADIKKNTYRNIGLMSFALFTLIILVVGIFVFHLSYVWVGGVIIALLAAGGVATAVRLLLIRIRGISSR